MSLIASIRDAARRLDLERFAELRPSYPPVAFEVDRGEIVAVRLRPRRRGKPSLESHQRRSLSETTVGSSILRPNVGAPDEMSHKVRELFEATGTKPGRVSIVLPDNLAKISVVTLPERPTSRKQLGEILRFKLRRAIPFRLEDAIISHQILAGDGPEVNLLVGVMLRPVVEQYESAFVAAGARPGLVDLCTVSLYNLCRNEMARAHAADGRDVALLNCARGYFSLAIARGGRLLFFRCKSQAPSEEEPNIALSAMSRELTSSLSYYEQRLSGQGIGAVFVRSTTHSLEEIGEVLARVGLERAVPVDPSGMLGLAPGLRLDREVGQRIAPCVGAASGRTAA